MWPKWDADQQQAARARKTRTTYRQEYARCCLACAGRPDERHHLVPVAAGGKNHSSNLVTLCFCCHRLAHRLWGGGDNYKGPSDRAEFIAELYRERREE